MPETGDGWPSPAMEAGAGAGPPPLFARPQSEQRHHGLCLRLPFWPLLPLLPLRRLRLRPLLLLLRPRPPIAGGGLGVRDRGAVASEEGEDDAEAVDAVGVMEDSEEKGEDAVKEDDEGSSDWNQRLLRVHAFVPQPQVEEVDGKAEEDAAAEEPMPGTQSNHPPPRIRRLRVCLVMVRYTTCAKKAERGGGETREEKGGWQKID